MRKIGLGILVALVLVLSGCTCLTSRIDPEGTLKNPNRHGVK